MITIGGGVMTDAKFGAHQVHSIWYGTDIVWPDGGSLPPLPTPTVTPTISITPTVTPTPSITPTPAAIGLLETDAPKFLVDGIWPGSVQVSSSPITYQITGTSTAIIPSGHFMFQGLTYFRDVDGMVAELRDYALGDNNITSLSLPKATIINSLAFWNFPNNGVGTFKNGMQTNAAVQGLVAKGWTLTFV